MSDPATKLEQQQSTEGPARRTYASLEMCRGFRIEGETYSDRAVISICPLDDRTYWKHVGASRWDSAGALYERVEGA